MHIESLKIFCDLVELKSFSRAAEKNFISQSAVSQQLAQFETEFKSQLLIRSKRPFELTEAGELFYDASKEIIARYQKFKSNLSSLADKSQNRIRIGAIFSIGMHSLQPYVKKFLSRYSSVMVDVDFCASDKIYQDVLNGEIDIGLVAVPRMDKNVEMFSFIDEPLVLVCSPDNPLALRKEVNIHELQMQRFVGFGKNVPTRLWIDGILKRYNMIVHTVMEFDNTETIKRAIEINSGVSILPKSTISSEVSAGSLAAVNFSNEKLVRPTGIIVNKNRIFSEPAKYLLNLLQNKK